MGAGNALRDMLDQDTIDRLAAGRSQTFGDQGSTMTVGPMGSSSAGMDAGASAPPPPASFPTVDVSGRASIDPSLAPPGAALTPQTGVGLVQEPQAPGPASAPTTGNPYVDAAQQAALDPSLLSPEQMILLGQKQGAPGGGSVSQTVRSTTKQLHTPGLDKALADEAALQEKIAKRTEEIGKAQGESAVRVAEQTHAYAGELQARTADIQAQQAANEEALTKQAGRMEEQRAQYVRDAGKIDPNRILHGRVALVGLAQALGAFGSTLGHTQNFAQQIIASKLEADLDAQKVALAAKKDNLSFAQQAYVNHSAQFQNQIAAKRAAVADTYDVFAAQLSEHAVRLKGTEQEQGALNSADAFRLKAQEERSNALKLEAGTLQTQVTSQRGGAGAKQDTALEQVVKGAEAKTKIDKAWGAGADGAVTTQDRTHYNKVLEQVSHMGAALDDAKRLKDLNEQTTEVGRNLPFTDAAHQQGTASSSFARNYNHAISGAASTDAEFGRTVKQLEGGAWSSATRNLKLSEMQRTMANEVAHSLSTLPPALQADAMKRAERFGITRDVIEAMSTGKPPKSGADHGASLGFGTVK